MRFTWKDAFVTALIAAVAVPYIGYLVRGSMPFIEDPRGMAATGLVLGLIAAAVAGRDAFTQERFGRLAEIVGFVSLGTGLATLIWAESGTLSDVAGHLHGHDGAHVGTGDGRRQRPASRSSSIRNRRSLRGGETRPSVTSDGPIGA